MSPRTRRRVLQRYVSLWRMRAYVRPYSRQMVVMALAAAGGVAASTVIPLVMEAVVNGPIRRGDRGALVPMFLAAFALGVAEAGLIFFRRLVQSVAVLKVERDIRDEVYRHLQTLDVGFHDQWQTGQLLSRATTDLSSIRRFLGFGAIFLGVNLLQYVTVLCLLLATYLPLGLLVVVLTVPVIALARQFGTQYKVLSRRLQDQQGDLATSVEEAASGIRVTKAFGRGAWLHGRFTDDATMLRGSALEMVRVRGRFWSLLELFPNLTIALVLLIGAIAVAHHSMSLGALVAFMALLVLLQWPIVDIGWILAMAEEAASAADRIYEVFDTPPAVRDAPSVPALRGARGRLEFDKVGFTYPGADRATLHDVSLVLEPGEVVALVGATGSGKTTLTGLPPRLYDVTRGAIRLDGVDVRELSLTELRTHVATAFEDPILFSMSVRENLVLGRPDAPDAELEAAIDLAQAKFVYDLPWGLDTRIGEQGLSLSGGQRQRLALARAVLTKPSVLVLDDPLSSLDVHTESLVEQALASVLKDTTALLVVHRPSTIALADRVALLANGTIAAIGSHSELMQRPDYAHILAATDDERLVAS